MKQNICLHISLCYQMSVSDFGISNVGVGFGISIHNGDAYDTTLLHIIAFIFKISPSLVNCVTKMSL